MTKQQAHELRMLRLKHNVTKVIETRLPPRRLIVEIDDHAGVEDGDSPDTCSIHEDGKVYWA